MAGSAQPPRSHAGPSPSVPGDIPPPRNWRALFLERLAETSSVARAAEHAGIDPGRAYRTRRTEPDFANQWRAALAEGYLHLELELLRRLREGDFRTADDERYDIANAIRLLAGRRDAGAAGRGQHPDVSAAEVRESIDRKLADIRRRIDKHPPDEMSDR